MKKIILADDSSTARMFVRKCLEIAGLKDAEFIEAANGKEALDVVQKGGADLLVTDLNMPVMDGTDLVRRIRSDKRWEGLRILVITSGKNPAKEAELTGLGASAVLSKPISPSVLVKALKTTGII